MRRSLAAAGLLVTVLVSLAGCSPTGGGRVSTPSPPPRSPVRKEAVPVPTNTVEIEKLGIPVYPGAVLAEDKDSATLDEKSLTRTYKVKMYAPANYTTVLGHYMRSVKKSQLGGASEFQKVTGQSPEGDAIEVWIGPAAGKDRSLVMAWLTQSK